METERTGSKTFRIVTAAVMVAIIAVLSQIAVPMPSGVPVTLQTFAIALCAYFLEARYSVLAVIVYVLLGLVGVPVFANFGAGPARLFGVTGGFIWGFVLLALCCSFAMRSRNTVVRLGLGILGLLLCHLCGIIQFTVISNGTFLSSALLVSVPYLIKDVVSVVLAYLISLRLHIAVARIRKL